MKIVVVSNPRSIINEFQTLNDLFFSGLEVFHLRKPAFSKDQYETFIKQIPPQFWDRIMIHDHFSLALKYNLRGIHLSGKHKRKNVINNLKLKYILMRKPELKVTATMHSLYSFLNYREEYEYVFLSPVFDAISDKKCKSPFKLEELKLINSNPEYNVVAMGGIQEETLPVAQELGFGGVALLGTIWRSTNPGETFNNVLMNLQQLKTAC